MKKRQRGLLVLATHGIMSFFLLASFADAALRHKYTFNDGTADDSIGTADFTLNGGALVGGGGLFLPGGAHQTSYASAEGGSLTELGATLAPANLSSAVSIEIWYNQSTAANWSKLFMAGIDTPDAFEYLDLTPRRGDGTGFTSASLNSGAFNGNIEDNVQTTVQNTNGVDYYLAAVWDNTVFDAVSAGQLTIHHGPVGGSLETQSVALSIDNFLTGLTVDSVYLGAAVQFADPDFNGTIDELRIHDSPLTMVDVDSSFATGPDPFFGPTATINRDTGNITLSNGSSPIQITGIQIASGVGALDSSGWLSVSDNYDADSGGGFDSDDTWSISNSDAFTLSEATAVGDGGSLGGVPLDLGAAWGKSIVEDLSVIATLSDASQVPLAVEFTGNGGSAFARSDLNFDGVINADDWPLFLAGNQADLAALSPAEAYRMGDLNGDLANNYADFQIFFGDFEAANGPGSFTEMIPEPSGLALSLMVAGLMLIRRR